MSETKKPIVIEDGGFDGKLSALFALARAHLSALNPSHNENWIDDFEKEIRNLIKQTQTKSKPGFWERFWDRFGSGSTKGGGYCD